MRWGAAAVCLGFLAGCGGDEEQALTPAEAEIAYLDFTISSRGRHPAVAIGSA